MNSLNFDAGNSVTTVAELYRRWSYSQVMRITNLLLVTPHIRSVRMWTPNDDCR